MNDNRPPNKRPDTHSSFTPLAQGRSGTSSNFGIGVIVGIGIGLVFTVVNVAVVMYLNSGKTRSTSEDRHSVADLPNNSPAPPPNNSAALHTESSENELPVPSSEVAKQSKLMEQPAVEKAATPKQSPKIEAENIAAFAPKPGSAHFYKLKMTNELGGMQETVMGDVLLNTFKQPPAPVTDSARRPEKLGEIGTGFVVAANGLVVTCAHVVQNVQDLELQIGGTTYPATVLHTDDTVDLAILKVDATDLLPVSLGQSKAVQLGDSLAVIGFPLADLLGSGINVSQGFVTGIGLHAGQASFQTDAAINPGNSGGPVFNLDGQVIGIANAKLHGPAVSQIGLCIPSETLMRYLSQRGYDSPTVNFHSAKGAAVGSPNAISGLINRVKPSIALVRGGGLRAPTAQIGFNYQAFTFSTKRPKNGSIPMFGSRPDSSSDIGTLTMNEMGQVVELTEGESIPLVMMRLPMLPFIELRRGGQTDWTVQSTMSLVHEDRSRADSPLAFRNRLFENLLPREFSARPRVMALQKAIVREQFHVDNDTPQRLELSRKYEISSIDDSQPTLQVTASGKWSFDRTTAMPEESTLSGTFGAKVENVAITIPFSISVRPFTATEIATHRAAMEKAMQAANAPSSALPTTSIPLTSTESLGLPNQKTEPNDSVRIIESTSWGFNSLACSPSGRFVAVTSQSRELTTYDMASGALIASQDELKNLGFQAVSAFSPDGKHLLIASADGDIQIWQVDEQGKFKPGAKFLGHGCDVLTMVIMPDNKTVISCDSKKRMRRWSLVDQREVFAIADDDTGECAALGLDAHQRMGMMVDRSGQLSRFNIANGKSVGARRLFQSHFGTVALFSADGSRLFVPQIYDVHCFFTKDEVPAVRVSVGESIWCLAHCTATNELFVGGSGRVHVCDVAKARVTQTLRTGPKASGYVKHVAVSPDGRYVVAIGGPIGQSLVFFDRQTKRPDAP